MTTPIRLKEVDEANLRAIIDLSVSESQKAFVAPNVVSLAQAFVSPRAWVRAVYAGDQPVGFVMLSDDDEKPRYYLWRFMIDQQFQGQGYGIAALELVHEYVRTRPQGTEIYLSYVRAEGGPEDFYKKFGYVDTGEIHDGEHEAVCKL